LVPAGRFPGSRGRRLGFCLLLVGWWLFSCGRAASVGSALNVRNVLVLKRDGASLPNFERGKRRAGRFLEGTGGVGWVFGNLGGEERGIVSRGIVVDLGELDGSLEVC